MKNYLFIFTIGPVQSFIAQARKTVDLYASSALLSALIKEAIKKLPLNADIIFPNKELESMPNRFLAKIELENDDEAYNLGCGLEKDLKKFFFKEIYESLNLKIEKTKIENQINDFLDVYWVFLESSENYEADFKKTESYLGSVKTVKSFNQISEIIGRKCSLCGERNAVFTNKNASFKKDNPIDDRVNVENSIDLGEALCSVCFGKRKWGNKSFPSTAKIALMDSLEYGNKISKIERQLSDYKKLFSDMGVDFDSQLLFEENINFKYFEKAGISKSKIDEKIKKIRNIKKLFNENNLKMPGYYSLVMFDGDSMGKFLSGEFLINKIELGEFHSKLSSLLGAFAKKANEILIEPRGKIIYAGGEDFLGFININHLFNVLKELRIAFKDIVSKGLSEYLTEGTELTFSAGILITHYKNPLSDALSTLRNLEKVAKTVENKNAFTLAVMKHSGETLQTTYSWGNKADTTLNLELIADLTENLYKEEFSNTFIKAFDKTFRKFLDSEGNYDNRDLLLAELNRLIIRSEQIAKPKGMNYEDFKAYKKEKIEAFQGNLAKLLKNASSLEEFLFALEIAEFVSRYLNGGKK